MTMLARLRHAPGRAARNTAFLASGVLPHATGILMWLWLMLLLSKAQRVAPEVLAVSPCLAVALSAVQRWRYRLVLGVEIPRLPAPAVPLGPRRALKWLRSPGTWRQAGYHAFAGPVLMAAELLVLSMWVVGAVAASYYLWVWSLPPETKLVRAVTEIQAAYLTAAGVLLLVAAGLLADALKRAETVAAGSLLGPSQAARLQRRVDDLTESRAGVIDAADAERRRIERNLHDGAQQRLVSLAVNLGLAKETLTDLPASARKVIDEAHAEAKAAIAELGDLVRGLHPAVLEDRGLDAALSGLVARSPVPGRLRVDLAGRPPPAVESAAYFVVAEALANVTKHARATKVRVVAEQDAGMLRVSVTDDGVGGAAAGRGSGLTGLASRVTSLDGQFTITSPAGGPTVVTAEFPCRI
jgi:signal transduction histidine kinase